MHRCWLARILVCVVGVVSSVLAGTPSPGADPTETWPQRRGPTRDGFVRELNGVSAHRFANRVP